MSFAMDALVVLDRFEHRAALAAAVLKRHGLRAEQRDDIGVARAAVRAARLRPRFASVRTFFLRGHATCQTCGRRLRRVRRDGASGPTSANRWPISAPSSPAVP